MTTRNIAFTDYQQKIQALRDAIAEGLQDVAEGRTINLGVGEGITEYLARRASEPTNKD